MQDDDEVVKAAVTSNGKALQYVSIRLKKDRSIAYLAAISNGLGLEFSYVNF